MRKEATFLQVSEVFERIEATSSRNEISEILREFILSVSPEDAAIFSYLLMGRIAPLFVPAEFNFSEKNMVKILVAIARQNGLTIDVESLRKSSGDIGLVASEVVSQLKQVTQGQTLQQVYEELWSMLKISGSGSVAAKSRVVVQLLGKLSALEAKFLSKVIVGKLRSGVSLKSVLDTLSIILSGDKKLRSKLDDSFGVDPDIGHIVSGVLVEGEGFISDIKPKLGIPISSRLVERVSDFEEVFERLGEKFYLQPKFDGLRCQVHKGVSYEGNVFNDRVWANHVREFGQRGGMFAEHSASTVRLFSRNLEEMTEMFPEIVEAVQNLPCDSCILDCEAVGYNPKSGKLTLFQETMTRKRKHGIDEQGALVPLRLFAFDILQLNDESMIGVGFEKRVETLQELLAQVPHSDPKQLSNGIIKMAESRLVNTLDEVNEFFAECVSEGLEGLIAKQLTGGYQPGVRNYEWIKLKKSMDKQLVDSVDVVIMGYYYGSGKKSGFGMGALLAGVYDPIADKIESITKIGTGITDEQWVLIAARLKQFEVGEKPVIYDDVPRELKPDIWLTPDVVCTVEADEVTVSKQHRAGMAQLGYAVALRFPRLIEFDRDKRFDQTTSVLELSRFAK